MYNTMVKRYLALVGLLSFAGGLAGPIAVSLAMHRWRIDVESLLPGGAALFVPPIFLAILGLAGPTLFYQRTVGSSAMLTALAIASFAAIVGFIASFPFLCAIARECL